MVKKKMIVTLRSVKKKMTFVFTKPDIWWRRVLNEEEFFILLQADVDKLTGFSLLEKSTIWFGVAFVTFLVYKTTEAATGGFL